MLLPVRGPSRLQRLKTRKIRGWLGLLSNVAAVLVVICLLTVVFPAFPAMDEFVMGQVQTAFSHEQPPPPPKPQPVAVFITGAVVVPGVVCVPADATVGDVLKLAGGPAAGADLSQINPAQPVQDEMVIRVSSKPVKAPGGKR